MLHTVIANAVAGDPYPIEVLFLYMANMAWNSAMNTAETMEMLDRTDASGEYVIPRIIVADSYSSEIVAFADLVLPTPPTSSATTASACSTGRSPSPTPPPTRSAGRSSSPSARATRASAASSRCCSTSAPA